jgi:hypothetical protein
MTPDRAVATAADYADALITARKAVNILILILLLILLSQLAVFFVGRYTDILPVAGAAVSTTGPMSHLQAQDWMYHIVGLADFLGIALAVVLAMVLLLIVKVMLVGRLIGVGRLTSAYIWCIVLLVLLFPWQAFLDNSTFNSPNLRVPGVLYTWNELILYAKFSNTPFFPAAFLHWSRFVVFPVIAVLNVLTLRVLSSRGLRLALGEIDPPMLPQMPS